MNAMREAFLREQLYQRRERLQAAIAEYGEAKQIVRLLDDIDAALQRMPNGTYGFCETCNHPIEEDRLIADPCLRFCLDHLTQDQRTALEHDLRLASTIQNHLLPKLPVSTNGWNIQFHYQPAGAVSGDYCDILVDSQNDNIYFIIGDVSGKGVAASMMMTHLHALFRTLITQQLPLNQLVEQANRVFSESTSATLFATLVCGKLSGDGAVELSNAGHNPPILLRKNNTIIMEATGMPVGIFSNLNYGVHREKLVSGDSLILYTDGVSEQKNAESNEFGDERVKESVQKMYEHPPGKLIESFIGELEYFRGTIPYQDDITFMVIRRES
jgi:phosphoserine phosphatase RsbU/P